MFYWSKDDLTFSGQGEGLESSVTLNLINETIGKSERSDVFVCCALTTAMQACTTAMLTTA